MPLAFTQEDFLVLVLVLDDNFLLIGFKEI